MREQSAPFRTAPQTKQQQQPLPSLMQQRKRVGANADEKMESTMAQFDYSLDLGKYRDNVSELFSAENRARWFELSSNNALLSFLLSVSLKWLCKSDQTFTRQFLAATAS